MNDLENLNPPLAAAKIYEESRRLGFEMVSEPRTGSLLRTLATSKPAGRFLELGGGTGAATAWMLDGMDAASSLISVDSDPALAAVARKHLGHDPKLTLVVKDAAALLEELQGQKFDFIFADTWGGKFERLELALNLLKLGGLYVIDDMNPQRSWPAGHAPKVERLLGVLEDDDRLRITKLSWASGIVVAVRVA